MKIKVSFSKVVDADSLDDAYKLIMDDLKEVLSDDIYDEHGHIIPERYHKVTRLRYMKCHGKITDINGLTFEELGTHSGYGEGSVEQPSIQDYIDQ